MSTKEDYDTKTDIEAHAVAVPETILTKSEINRLWFKIDIRVITPLTLIYLLQYMDKSNIGNAKIAGLQDQLHISSNQYTWVLSVFYFSYGLFEIPSNMILKRIRPSIWLCTLCATFGLCLALMGLATSYKGLLVARFFLGVTTAGVYPGASYYFTLWYPRDKLAFRFSLFFVAATLAGSFSGLISAAIANMSGVGGKLGWSWIFIIMGCIAIFGGIVLYPIMQDYPETSKFLTDREKEYVLAVLRKDQGHNFKVDKGSDKTLTRKDFKNAALDWQTWSFCIQYYCTTVPLFSLAIFIPSIVQGLGYSGTHAQLMSVPPFAVSVPFVVGIAWLSDHYKRRAPFITLGFVVGLVGWIVLVVAKSNGAKYAAAIIASIGHWSIPAVSCMAMANCIAGNAKRAVAIGICMGLGNLCGIITAQVFRSSDAPRYLPGLHAMIFFAALGLVQTLILWPLYNYINKKRAAEWESSEKTLTDDELQELGDRAPNFKYMFP